MVLMGSQTQQEKQKEVVYNKPRVSLNFFTYTQIKQNIKNIIFNTCDLRWQMRYKVSF